MSSTLVISGFPRSGTTWLAEVILQKAGTGLIFEPLHFGEVKQAEKAGFSYHNFRDPDEEWSQGFEYMQSVLQGKILNRWTTSYMTLPQAMQVNRWVVKFVRANQILGWITTNFDIPPPLLLIRHPCAIYSSWVHRGWPLINYPPPAHLRFFQAFPQFLDYVQQLKHQEEFFAALWSMQYFSARKHMADRPFYLCVYETLLDDPMREIQQIYSHWNLGHIDSIDHAVANPSAKASNQLASSTEVQLSGWRKRLDSLTIKRMLAVTNQFGIDFYDDSPMPDASRMNDVFFKGLN